MICPSGWMKAFLKVLWEDKWLILKNLRKEVLSLLTKYGDKNG